MVTKVEKKEEVVSDEEMTASKVFMMHSGRKAEKVDIEKEDRSGPRVNIEMLQETLSWKELSIGAAAIAAVGAGVWFAFKKFRKSE